ncbi:hypothetical protein D3C72_1372050 [compost metagenome]
MTRDRIDRLVMGGRRAGDTMAQFLDQAFNVSRDDGLVLDDQNVGGQFGVDVGLGFGDQTLDRPRIDAENLGGFRGREPLQGRQQEGLSRARRDPHQAARGVVADAVHAAAVLKLGAGRGPDGVEDVIESNARRHVRRQLALAGRQRLQGHPHIVVAGDLIARQGPRIAADIGQMRRKPGQ